MLTENLALLFERDILKIKAEITAYSDPSAMWKVYPGIKNSGGNLTLHLLGNLQNYIGAVLGGSGYIRNRPEEFSLTDIPVGEIIVLIDRTVNAVVTTIRSLDEVILQKEYPEQVLGYAMTTEYFLLHLLAHLNYHLGQINYHRRMVS